MYAVVAALAAAALNVAGHPFHADLNRRLDALNQCVTEAAQAGRFSGVVAVGHNGKPIRTMAFGHPDLSGTERMTAETRFNIASVGKMFTAVAVAQLVDRGLLHFDEKVGSILPGLPPELAGITIEQLLTHRSGLGDYLRPESAASIRSAKTATDLLPLAIKDGLLFRPGSKQQYSNSGFVILGAIIEKLSGQSYSDYVRRHIFAPAGMATADLVGDVSRAVALTKRNADGTASETAHPAPIMGGNRASPAGGATASVLDLLRFGEALRNGKLVSRKALRQLWAARVPGAAQGEGELSYGYGFARMDFPGGRWLVGHNGGSLGVNAEFELLPDEGYAAVALSNYDPPSATNAIAMARRALLDEEPCARE